MKQRRERERKTDGVGRSRSLGPIRGPRRRHAAPRPDLAVLRGGGELNLIGKSSNCDKNYTWKLTEFEMNKMGLRWHEFQLYGASP